MKQEEEYSSKRDLIKFVTTLGLELHEDTSKLSTSGMEMGAFILQLLGPSLVMACPIGNPFQPHFQVTHMQVVNIFPRALGKKQEAGQAAELRCCLSNMPGQSWFLPQQLA